VNRICDYLRIVNSAGRHCLTALVNSKTTACHMAKAYYTNISTDAHFWCMFIIASLEKSVCNLGADLLFEEAEIGSC
jgi:hypothetical protein